MNLVVILVLLAGVYGFACLAGFRTKRLSSHTNRTAEDLYDTYADSVRQQERFADRHGGSWRVDDPPNARESQPRSAPGSESGSAES